MGSQFSPVSTSVSNEAPPSIHLAAASGKPSSVAMSLPATLSPSLTPREAITDTLYRFMYGMDTNDATLFDSAFTQDVRWSLNGNIIDGLKAVHSECFDRTICNVDTTHFVTNMRIHIADEGSEASMSALYQAQHYARGRGKVPGSTSFVTGGLYYMDLVRDTAEGLWKIKLFKMESTWKEGDVTIMGHD